jgi:branched-chain amino acid aminotransferase
LHYGSCVFEGERAYNGRIFESEFHSKRLLNSAQALGFKIPYTVEELECAKAETLKKQGLSNAYVRAMSWRGSETVGISAQNNTIHTAIIMWEWGAYYGDAKDKGAIMDISTWRRPSPDKKNICPSRFRNIAPIIKHDRICASFIFSSVF